MKKIVLGLGLLGSVFATEVLANSSKPNSGISLGVQGGYISHNGNLEQKNSVRNTNTSTDLNGNSGNIGLFLSYGMMLNHNFYAGLEVFGQYQDAKGEAGSFQNGTNTSKSTVNMKESYGGALKLGMLFKKDILTYVKLGAVSTKFNFTTSDNVRGNGSSNNRKTGFLAGLGAQVPISNNWFIGAEWNYTWYGNISTKSSDGKLTYTYKPHANNINLRLGYTF